MTLGHLSAVGYAVAAFPLRVLLPAEHGRATVRQEKDSEPLSMEYMTMEFSSMPRPVLPVGDIPTHRGRFPPPKLTHQVDGSCEQRNFLVPHEHTTFRIRLFSGSD